MKILFKCEVDPAHPGNRRVRASVKGNVLTFTDKSVENLGQGGLACCSPWGREE